MEEILQAESTSIDNQTAIVRIRQTVRDQAKRLKFSITDQTKLVTAASELARNTFDYAEGGNFTLEVVDNGRKKGLRLIFADQGPGIEDLDSALSPGYSTSNGLGMGLGGSRKLVDEFDIQSEPGRGTTITITKWA